MKNNKKLYIFLLRFCSEEPPSFTASLANIFHFSFAFSPLPITTSRHLFISPASTTPSSSSSSRSTLTPVFHTSSISFAFVFWSTHCGNATIGTPDAKLSIVEFQPQCVTKHPNDPCDKTSTCEHHSTIFPLASNSSLQLNSSSSSSSFSFFSFFLITHKNGCLESNKARAISSICFFANTQKLPNDT
ncbi:hypothetical protein Ahy_B03g061784 [Arachis hypogaea]|uniref:Uncharacterized protein n=1 Tax=Arachis hypogaea TaxID=3818 RepID=A0A444ZRZ5_ARAHY|nr:hypothetical protein Ahy_B03g061784 [Arachis hypogaea]